MRTRLFDVLRVLSHGPLVAWVIAVAVLGTIALTGFAYGSANLTPIAPHEPVVTHTLFDRVTETSAAIHAASAAGDVARINTLIDTLKDLTPRTADPQGSLARAWSGMIEAAARVSDVTGEADQPAEYAALATLTMATTLVLNLLR